MLVECILCDQVAKERGVNQKLLSLKVNVPEARPEWRGCPDLRRATSIYDPKGPGPPKESKRPFFGNTFTSNTILKGYLDPMGDVLSKKP